MKVEYEVLEHKTGKWFWRIKVNQSIVEEQYDYGNKLSAMNGLHDNLEELTICADKSTSNLEDQIWAEKNL